MTIQRVKGMYDLGPEVTPTWHRVESVAINQLNSFGFREIRLPLLEKTELFSRAIGQETDVVSKEMYTFEDLGGDRLSLRPEGTAGCVRAAIAGGLLHQHSQKLWYAGPMFRRENVQRGRNRQFYQIGAEAFGLEGPDVDAEMVLMLYRTWQQLGLTGLTLEVNSLGTAQSRRHYREVLVAYLRDHYDALDEDSQRRLDLNPLRVLDSKRPEMQAIIEGAPSLLEHLDLESKEHFAGFKSALDAVHVPYVVNERLVRGLDYYTRTVFEFKTDQLGSQGTVCAGGRYDGLVEMIGGGATPGVGFSMGVDRLVALMDEQERSVPAPAPDAYLVARGEEAEREALVLADELRSELAGFRVTQNLGGGSFKAQFKRADKSGARWALVLGEGELADGTVQLKPLREEDPPLVVPRQELVATLAGKWKG